MAKQKRLNKNLVAFLTIMGMIIILSVFTLIVYQQSRRDPALLARMADEAKLSGDLDEAWRRYLRAWDASEKRGQPQPKYMIAAANCLFQMGEIGNWRGLLEKTSSKLYQDPSLPAALLEGLWQIEGITGGVIWPELWRDAAEKLRQLDEKNVLALTSLARALWEMRGPENEARADEAARQAYELAPDDPRVAMTYGLMLNRQVQRQVRQGLEAGQRDAELEELRDRTIDQVLEILNKAVQQHPEDGPLAITCAEYLRFKARRADQAGQLERAGELFAQARDLLTQAIEANPQQPSPDLHLALAQHQLEQFDRAHRQATAAQVAEDREHIEQIDSLARRAIELDPAMYEAWMLRAELAQRFGTGPQGQELSPQQRVEKTLELFDQASEKTRTLRSLRALLRTDERLLMLRRAFDIALAYETAAATQPSLGQPAARAEAYLDEARVKYQDHPVTYYMQAQLAISRNDPVAAIAALEQAQEKAEQISYTQAYGQARYWLAYARVTRLPAEQLALLYAQRSQWGEAARYAEMGLRQFRQAALNPPVTLVATRAEVLRQIGKASDALELLDEYRRTYPDDPTLAAVRVNILADLGRKEEAKGALAEVPETGASTVLWRGAQAVEQEDYAEAERSFRAVMSDQTATDDQYREALQRLINLLTRTNRREEARQLVAALKHEPPRQGLMRLLQRFELDLSVEDPAKLTPEQRKELDAKLEQLIADTPNAMVRAQEYYQYYAARGEWAEALKHLEELRRQLPQEIRLVEEELRVRLRLRQFDQATQLVALLAQYDGGEGLDHAGGATYRGDLELNRGNPELAIREYRQAIQKLPKSAELEVKLARAYLASGRVTEALDALQRAVAINPRSFEAWWYLRQIYQAQAEDSVGPEKASFQARADECQARAMELNPDHPQVILWKQQAEEEKNPLQAIAQRLEKWKTDPGDLDNQLRLAELLIRASYKLSPEQDPAAAVNLGRQGDQFFQAAIAAATGDTLTKLARAAAEFYAVVKLAEPGAALMRGLVEKQTGENRLDMQLLVAKFYEALPNLDLAEREYQQAQRMVREIAQGDEMRRRLELKVGMEVVGFHQRHRRLDKVVEACRWLLDRLGTDPSQSEAVQRVRLTLIEALFNAGRFPDAETEIDDYLAAYPDDLSGLTARAQLRLIKRDREAAVEDLNRILEKSPDDVLARYSRGRCALERGQYDKAREDLTKAEQLIARSPRLEADLRRLLASLYTRTKQYDLAITQLKTLLEVLEREGAGFEARQTVVRQLARLLYLGLDQFDQARRLVSEYMEKHPNEPSWASELARLFEAHGAKLEQEAARARERGDSAKERDRQEAAQQDYLSAATYYQRVAEKGGEKDLQEVAAATLARMGALTKAGRAQEAISLFGKIEFDRWPAQFRSEFRARMMGELAKAYQKLNQEDAARKQWTAALAEAAGSNINLVMDLAGQLRDSSRGRTAEVEGLLRDLVQNHPLDSPVGQRMRIVLAAYLAGSGNAAGALPLLSEVSPKLAPGTPEQLAATLMRAQVQEITGDREGAIRSYKEVLAVSENNTTALNNLAYTLVTSDPPLFAPAEAKKYAEKLRGLITGGGEGAANMLDTIGWVYFKNNEPELAVAALEEALSLGSPTSTLCLHLGQVYQKLGRNVEARTMFTQGLALARQSGNQEEIQQLEEGLSRIP